MKKNILFIGVVGCAIALGLYASHTLYVNAQLIDPCSSQNSYGCAGDFNPTPSLSEGSSTVVTDTMQISGIANGAIFPVDSDCSMNSNNQCIPNTYQENWTAPTLDSPVDWEILPAPPTGTPPDGVFSLTQTAQGNNGTETSASSYQYTFNFTISGLSVLPPGTYYLQFSTTDSMGHSVNAEYPLVVPATAAGVVPPATTSNGTISVTSENANDTSIPVPSAWDLSATDATNGFVCSATGELGSNLTFPWIDGTLCSGTQRTYAKVPAPTAADGGDLVGIPKTETTTVPYYSFRSIEQVPIAEKKNNSMAGQIKLSLNNIFSTVALADEVGIWNGATTTLTRYQLLTSAYNSIAFNILWNPLVADMTVSPDTIYFASSGSMSQVETIRATGAPSAKLDWTASASTASGGNWLSVSLSSNSILIDGSGSGTGTATISAASGLPNGKYQGSVTFKGSDPNNKDALVAIRTVSVTLVVTSPGGGPPYFACAAGVCEETSSTSGGSSCINACGGGSTLTAACAPSTVTLSPLETSQCVLDLNGVAQDGSWAVAPGSAGSIGTSSGVYTPSSAGTETVVGTNTDGTSADAAITVTSGGPPPLPDCASAGKCPVCSSGLTATPSSILVPESSNLSYSCSNVTECQISAPTGQFSTSPDVPVPSGNVSTTPSITTTYTLTCVNSNYATSPDNHQAGGSATVTVSGSSYCEQNPNGVGCQ
jgi:hypothetical protein